MNNKGFIAALSEKMNLNQKETQTLANKLVDGMVNFMDEGNDVVVSGFGSFEVKKKNERVITNPSTGKRMLVPPKLTVNFKLSKSLKDKTKEKPTE